MLVPLLCVCVVVCVCVCVCIRANPFSDVVQSKRRERGATDEVGRSPTYGRINHTYTHHGYTMELGEIRRAGDLISHKHFLF